MQKKTKVGIAFASSVLVVALGVTGGLLIAGALEPSRQYDFGSEGAMDRGKLLEAYEHLGDSKNVDYTEEFTPAEAANVAYGLFERNERFATRGEGLATALFGVKQEIFSTQIREGETTTSCSFEYRGEAMADRFFAEYEKESPSDEEEASCLVERLEKGHRYTFVEEDGGPVLGTIEIV